jgi:hypothetical protein
MAFISMFNASSPAVLRVPKATCETKDELEGAGYARETVAEYIAIDADEEHEEGRSAGGDGHG